MSGNVRQPVRFGLSLPNRGVLFGIPIELLLESSELADASGAFDSVWVGDNLVATPRLEAIVTLSAIASRTRKVRLGTICLATFTMRHPLLLAIQWASLDRLSNGRTVLAVCLGKSDKGGAHFANELAAFGVQSNERFGRLREGVELLRGFWGSEPVSHEGRFYRFEQVDAQPKPAQQRVPIILASNPPWNAEPADEERALRRVAQIADGWQTDSVPPAVFRRRWNAILEYAEEYGRRDQITENSLHLMVNLNDDAEAAHRESVEFLRKYYGEGAVSPEKLREWLAYGPPSAVIERIAQYVEVGCVTPVLRFTARDQLGQLERCIAEVLPAFEGAVVGG